MVAQEPPDHFENARAAARALGFDAARKTQLEALIIALTSHGIEPGDPRVPRYLAPLLNIPQAGAQSVLLTDPESPKPRETDEHQEAPQADGRWTAGHMIRVGAQIAVVLLIIMALHGSTIGPDVSTGVPQPKPLPTPIPTSGSAVTKTIALYLSNLALLGYLVLLAALTALMVLPLALIRRWWEGRRLRQLRRDPLPDPSALVAIATRLARARLFSDPALATAMRKLRRHRAVPSPRIDLRSSIHATISNGRVPTLRFARRRLSPDYLLLSERERPHDHLAEVAIAWRERLGDARISCSHYEFFGDPNTLRPITDSAGRSAGPNVGRERLEGVLHRHEGAELVVMLESFDAIASSGSPPTWLAGLGQRVNPNLMNPREPRFWSEIEARLDDLGLSAFPASVAGTLELADRIDRMIDSGHADRIPPQTPGQADLAAFLAAHRSMVLSPNRPTDDQVATIIDTLERWLDADAFDWLRAIAVFPMVNRGFTSFVGCALKDTPIITHDRYLTLARLPWLRAAYMPDWLRLALVETLSPTALERAAATAAAFLQPPADGTESEVQLIELRRNAEPPAARKRLAEQLQVSRNPTYNDRLLIEILKGVPPDMLGVMIDRDLEEEGPGKRSRDRMMALAISAIGVAALFALLPPEGREYGVVPFGTRTVSEPGPEQPVPQPSQQVTPAPVGTDDDPTPVITPASPSPSPSPSPSRSPLPAPLPSATAQSCQPATGKENTGPWIVFFDWDKTDITPEAAGILDNVVANYRCGFNVLASGHADREKTKEYSLLISSRRSQSVTDYLVNQGIPRSAILGEAFGETRPIVPTADGVREPQNRRVEVTLIPSPDDPAFIEAE